MDPFENNENFPEHHLSDYKNHMQIIIDNNVAHKKKMASAKRAARYAEIYGGGMKRTNFTPHQCLALEKEFSQRAYIDRFRRDDMATELNLSGDKIRVWFRNRRAREFEKNRRLTSTSTSIHQPRPVPMFRSSRHLFGTLPHLMEGMSLAENRGNCGNRDNNSSCCCSTLTFNRTIQPNFKLQVMSHHDAGFTNVPSVDYGDDFCTDYNN